MGPRLRYITALALIVASLVGGLGSVVGPAAASTSSPTSAGAYAIRTGDADAIVDYRGFRYVVIKAVDTWRVPIIRAQNPDVKILAYKDMASTRSYMVKNGVDAAITSGGVGYAFASTYHPEWFLLDGDGNRIEWMGYSGHWWMDVGNRAYQQQWTENVLAEMRAYGWDGVMVDNANATRSYLGDRTMPAYPTDSAYAAATESFLASVGPTFRDAGFEFIPNISIPWSSTWAEQYRRWTGYTSGALKEFWAKSGKTTGARRTDNEWLYHLAQMEVVTSQGKTFLPVSYGSVDDVVSQTYARASFLLAWDGGPSSYVWTPDTADTDPWRAAWTVDLGTPSGPRYPVGSGFRRDFSGGTAVVNHSSSQSLSVSLHGHVDAVTGAALGDVVLAPATAVMARRTTGPATTTTTAPETTTTTAPATTTTTAPLAPQPQPAPSGATEDSATPNAAGAVSGYGAAAATGEVVMFGPSGIESISPSVPLRRGERVIGAAPASAGGWVATSFGAVYPVNGAPSLGSTGPLNQPIVGIASTPSGGGYWLVASDGGIFTFGDAAFLGSTGAIRLNRPVVGMASTPSGGGYWLVASDGGIFTFGDAAFLGSTGHIRLNRPITAMAATRSAAGYLMLAEDGGIFTFGDAPFYGAPSSLGLGGAGAFTR